MASGIPLLERLEQVCNGCTLGKQHRLPFPHASSYRAEENLELVHTELCGPISPATEGGNNYFLLVVDDHSRYMWLEVIKSKADAFQRFKKIKALAEAQSGRRLLAFRSDRGGEFNSTVFRQFCDNGGITHYTTAPYTPQQNRVVERRNQTTVEMAHCLLKSMAVPTTFWSGNFPTFLRKNENGMKIWKQKRKSAEQKRKRNFFGGSGNGNGTAISGGTDAKTEVSISD
jgi:hypothetical protein